MKEKRTFWVNLDGDGVCQFKPENVEGLSDTWVEVEDIKKYEPKKRWLKFVDISNPKNKTKIFRVINKESLAWLGEIKWHTGWRQYVFDDGDKIMGEGCQYELFEKIKELKDVREDTEV